MFHQLTAIEPVNLTPEANQALHRYAKKVVMYADVPADSADIIRRIGDADAILVTITSQITREIIESCPNLRYIGMCCSLYSEESASVDIRCARERGITVTGVRDYGDEGVAEYVVCELVDLLHGFHQPRWDSERPAEIGGLRVGVLGMGTVGQIVTRALRYFGADLSYYSRTRKPEIEAEGVRYQPLHQLLSECDVVCTCLSKHVVLLHEEEFRKFGNHKILFNTSLSPSYDPSALKSWLDSGDNHYFCDTLMALGDDSLDAHPRVHCAKQSAGMTRQAIGRLSRKVLDNIETFLTRQ